MNIKISTTLLTTINSCSRSLLVPLNVDSLDVKSIRTDIRSWQQKDIKVINIYIYSCHIGILLKFINIKLRLGVTYQSHWNYKQSHWNKQRKLLRWLPSYIYIYTCHTYIALLAAKCTIYLHSKSHEVLLNAGGLHVKNIRNVHNLLH